MRNIVIKIFIDNNNFFKLNSIHFFIKCKSARIHIKCKRKPAVSNESKTVVVYLFTL